MQIEQFQFFTTLYRLPGKVYFKTFEPDCYSEIASIDIGFSFGRHAHIFSRPILTGERDLVLTNN